MLLDVRMPNVDGLACLDEIQRALSRREGRDALGIDLARADRAALRRGRARLPREERRPERPALDATTGDRGQRVQHLAAAEESENDSAKAAGLTERERSILEALAKGKSNDEIAKELWVTQQTVKFHLTNIYRKLGVKNRTEATRLAYQRGLVENPDGPRPIEGMTSRPAGGAGPTGLTVDVMPYSSA